VRDFGVYRIGNLTSHKAALLGFASSSGQHFGES